MGTTKQSRKGRPAGPNRRRRSSSKEPPNRTSAKPRTPPLPEFTDRIFHFTGKNSEERLSTGMPEAHPVGCPHCKAQLRGIPAESHFVLKPRTGKPTPEC